jgi:putative colanic acid biosynthesis UDP-glucose lipid carrier transferase
LPTLHDTQAHLVRSRPSPTALLRAAVDPAVAIAILLVSVLWFEGRFDGPWLILALLVFSMTFPGDPARDTVRAGELAGSIATSWLSIMALLLLLGWASGTLAVLNAHALIAWLIATPLALFAAHRLVPILLPRVLAAQGVQKTAVIAGANEAGRGLAARIRANPFPGIRFTGYFDDRSSMRLESGESGASLGSLDQLAEYVKAHRVDLIYIALPMASQPRILKLLEELRDTTASIYFAPDIFLFDLIQARMETIGGVPVLAVCESPFHGVDALIKRASDVILASVILLLVSPLMLAIAAGVKLDSPGPVLFKQRRYGLDGREIAIYKFRSMKVLEDGDTIRQAARDDPRVTAFGAFLRASSLDELPQFINVLQGRMSVVGPRPHAIAHNELYRRLIRGYMIRHKVRPGITGLAQVNGARGETDTLEKMRRRIEYDLDYLRHWSLVLDLKIILKTIVVLGKHDAY